MKLLPNSIASAVGLLLVSASASYAQASAAVDPAAVPETTPMGLLSRMAFLFLIVFSIFHLLVVKPQRKKQVEQQELLKALKKGDQVVTSGGLIGRVVSIEADAIGLEIAANVRVRCELSAITKRVETKIAA